MLQGKEPSSMQMETCTSVNGRTTRTTGRELTRIRTELPMKDTGEMTSRMGMASKYGLKGASSLASTRKGLRKVSVSTSGLMDQSTRVTG